MQHYRNGQPCRKQEISVWTVCARSVNRNCQHSRRCDADRSRLVATGVCLPSPPTRGPNKTLHKRVDSGARQQQQQNKTTAAAAATVKENGCGFVLLLVQLTMIVVGRQSRKRAATAAHEAPPSEGRSRPHCRYPGRCRSAALPPPPKKTFADG